MSEEVHSLSTELTHLVRAQQIPILESWMERQVADDSFRLDLIDEATLEAESREFLGVLASALGSGQGLDLDTPAWRPVLAYLDELSRARDEVGFSPSETAIFVLSLKRPVLQQIRDAGIEPHDPEVWRLVELFDRLALYTTEVFQRRREDTIRRQQDEMEELATPVVKVWDGILALPLIGTLDTRRSRVVTENLLDAIATTGSEVAIIDLTGVPAIDTRMAQHLMRTVAAARLMGATCILSGIRPQIAQTIVHLKIQLGDIETEATLAAALKTAFRRNGWHVAKD